MKKKLSLFAILPLLLISCNKEENPQSEDPAVVPEITVSDPGQLTPVLTNVAGTAKVEFTTNVDWTASVINTRADAWVGVTPTSGKAGKGEITITATENTGDERSATIQIKAGTTTKNVTLTQKQKDAITATASKLEFENDGGNLEIKVTSNIEYTFAIDDACKDWIKHTGTKATQTKTLSFSIDRNEDTGKRSGLITVTSALGDEKFTVYQEGSSPSIVISRNEYNLGCEGGQFSVEVKSNVNVTLQMPSDCPWLTEVKTKAMSTNTYTFAATANDSYDSRSAVIKFVNAENGLSESVSVNQTFKGAIVISKSSYEVDAVGGQISVLIGHNVDFAVSCPSWIEQSGTKSYREDVLEFTVKLSRLPESREGSIVFTSTDGAVSQKVKVIQSGADWSNTPADEFWYLSSAKVDMRTGSQMFDVAIQSNTWEDGCGVLKLAGDATSIVEYGLMAILPSQDYTITKIGLPSSLKVIGRGGLNYSLGALTELTIPEGVVEVKDDACGNLSALETVTLPSTLTKIGYAVFFNSPVKRFLGPCDAIIMDGQALVREYTYVDPKTGIDYSGDWIVKASSSAVNLQIPDGINAIDNNALYDCADLETIEIPSSVKFVGGDNFVKASKLRYIGGPYASADNRCYISYGELQAFAPAGIKSYTTPSSVTAIGASAFAYNDQIEKLVINDEVTEIKNYAFQYDPNLKHITLPSSLQSMGYDPFDHSYNIDSMLVRSLVPPSIGSSHTSEFSTLKVCVPDCSLELYKNSDDWNPYRQFMIPKHYEGLVNPTYYYSTDFSAKGHVSSLQSASKGNGIDIVIMGDAFSDRQIADGTYSSWMNKAMEAFFAVEPYKTYRELFNVWSVDVVSLTEGFSHGDGALKTTFGSGTFITGDTQAIRNYALYAVSESNLDNTTIIVIPNKDVYAGTCTYYKPSSVGGYAQGLSIGWIPASSNYETFSTTLNHEVGGHGFAKLTDEYYFAGTSPSQSDITGYTNDKNTYNWYANIDFTTSEASVSWATFLQDSRYASEGLGIYEGASFQYGAYRPRESSIMRYNTGGYNAPSREVIYKRIMSLAYGPSWTYDYEAFVDYDRINIPQSTKAHQTVKVPAPFKSEKDFIPLAPPVLL